MSDHDTKVLNTLVATTIDSAKGYEDAAERASDDRLKPIFDQFARVRRQTVDYLKDQVRQFGGTPEDSGTLKAAAHRRWLDLKEALGKGDRAVLKSVEAGETYIREKYEAALNDEKLSPGARNAIAEAFTSVASGKAQVSELRRRCGIPEPAQGSGGSWGKVGLGVGALAAVAGVAIATSKRRGSHGRATEDEFTLRLQTDENMRMISSKKVEGTSVIARDGERLGKVDSFMVDKYSGRVGYAVMTFGGTLGFGASLFPLPWSALTYDEDEGGYVIDMTKDELADAPRFEPSDEPEFNPEYRRRILVFYRPGGSAGSRGSLSAGSNRSGTDRSPGTQTGRNASSRRDNDTGGSSSRTGTGRSGRRVEGVGSDRLAAGGSDQSLGESGGTGGGFSASTGGSIGASSGNEQNKA